MSFARRILVGNSSVRENTYRAPILLNVEANTELGVIPSSRNKFTNKLNLKLTINKFAVADRQLAFANDSAPEVAFVVRYARISPLPAVGTNFTPPFEYGRIVGDRFATRVDTTLQEDVSVRIGELVAITTGSIAIVGVDVAVEGNPLEVNYLIRVEFNKDVDVNRISINCNALDAEHSGFLVALSREDEVLGQCFPVSEAVVGYANTSGRSYTTGLNGNFYICFSFAYSCGNDGFAFGNAEYITFLVNAGNVDVLGRPYDRTGSFLHFDHLVTHNRDLNLRNFQLDDVGTFFFTRSKSNKNSCNSYECSK